MEFNMIDARRIVPAGVSIWQVLLTLVFVAFSGGLALNLFCVHLQTMFVMSLITLVCIILDAIYFLFVIQCR